MPKIDKIRKQYSKVDDLHSRLETETGRLESLILPYLDFLEEDDNEPLDFSIFYQSGDGFVLQLDMMNAPLGACLDIIEQNGKLTYDDYLSLTI